MAASNSKPQHKKYTLLRDHRPKADKITYEMPLGGVLEFRSAFDYQDGELFTAMKMVQDLEEDFTLLPKAFRALSVDADANQKTLAEEGASDVDMLSLVQQVSEEVFSQMGSLGELKG